ncbi:MAG TPA: sigma-70 family RNA polymerase sigma factor [Pirellulales bacterium]|nr:sigma-70 family RNA polymerase sigma factor [Pirellulales bacterium]
MPDIADFVEFLRRIRAGDDDAAKELVERFEPLIRREVRLRIGDDRLNRAFDSVDISQSVLASFFIRASTGEYELDQPEQLTRLLVTMARNRVKSRARRERRQVRDVRRLVVKPGVLDEIADGRPSPFQVVSRKEQLERVKSSLTAKELAIFELRSIGLSWSEVAERLGGSIQARRMQLSRGIERVESELNLVE